jgi:UDP-N-acetylmuramoylalanine--D-glutamate ligase
LHFAAQGGMLGGFCKGVRAMAVSLSDKRVLVMGLGRFGGGVGVSRWLASQGARVTVNDAAPAEGLKDSIKALDGFPVEFRLGGHPEEAFVSADLIVVNPAVDRAKSPALQAALAKGVPTTTEMNLFLERCVGLTVGITGSVGKSTTTTLIYEALKAGLGQQGEHPRQDGSRVFLGGNIGRSLLMDLPEVREKDVVVLELSSFMLEETPKIGWSPRVAVVTNIFPNHLDRHGTMAEYTAAKQNILRFQKPDNVAILNADHDLVSRWAHLSKARVVKFTTRGPADKRLQLLIPGEHNQSNAAAALAVFEEVSSRVPGVDRAAAIKAIQEFPGLSHRLQLVHMRKFVSSTGRVRVVRFFNDSKATTPEASMTALQAFAPRTALFIVGGYDKHADLSAFEQLLADRAAGVITIGATGPGILEHLNGLSRDHASLRRNGAEGLNRAMEIAKKWVEELEGVEAVVLSPACASWDQFPNYEVRGETFARLSREMNP